MGRLLQWAGLNRLASLEPVAPIRRYGHDVLGALFTCTRASRGSVDSGALRLFFVATQAVSPGSMVTGSIQFWRTRAGGRSGSDAQLSGQPDVHPLCGFAPVTTSAAAFRVD